jgi:hypothetical protein
VQDCEHRYQCCDDSALRCESKPDGIFGKDTIGINIPNKLMALADEVIE